MCSAQVVDARREALAAQLACDEAVAEREVLAGQVRCHGHACMHQHMLWVLCAACQRASTHVSGALRHSSWHYADTPSLGMVT